MRVLGLLIMATVIGFWMLNSRVQAILDILGQTQIETEDLRKWLMERVKRDYHEQDSYRMQLEEELPKKDHEELMKSAFPNKQSLLAYVWAFGIIWLCIECFMLVKYGTIFR